MRAYYYIDKDGDETAQCRVEMDDGSIAWGRADKIAGKAVSEYKAGSYNEDGTPMEVIVIPKIVKEQEDRPVVIKKHYRRTIVNVAPPNVVVNNQPPVVNVKPPTVVVESPQVTVQAPPAPDVHVAPPPPAEVRVEVAPPLPANVVVNVPPQGQPLTEHMTVERDSSGEIIGIKKEFKTP